MPEIHEVTEKERGKCTCGARYLLQHKDGPSGKIISIRLCCLVKELVKKKLVSADVLTEE